MLTLESLCRCRGRASRGSVSICPEPRSSSHSARSPLLEITRCYFDILNEGGLHNPIPRLQR